MSEVETCTDAEHAEPADRSSGLLGVNRLGNAVLCYAWGETDLPEARIVVSAAGVRTFIVDAWLGADDDVDLNDIMAEVAAHDWSDGDKSWEFEIGGVRLTDVHT